MVGGRQGGKQLRAGAHLLTFALPTDSTAAVTCTDTHTGGRRAVHGSAGCEKWDEGHG